MVKWTTQKIEIVRLLACGLTMKEIAEKMGGCSAETIRGHCKNMYASLRVSGAMQLVIYCLKNRIISLEEIEAQNG